MARALLVGQAASPGTGVGRALLVSDRRAGTAGERPSATCQSEASTTNDEADRLLAAAEAAARELDELAAATVHRAGAETAAVLEAQALLARDPALLRAALERLAAGSSAEVATLEAADRQAAALVALDDPLFQARAADVRDVGRRIARWLTGGAEAELWHADGTAAVLITDDLLPSETAVLRPERVAGLALASGSLVGHTAILARALELPLVLGLGPAILAVDPRAQILVDGSRGHVLIEPEPEEIRALSA